MRTRQNISATSLVLALMLSTVALGQDKPLRIEGKVGVPNLVGGAVEYVLPDVGVDLIDNSLAPYVDFSAFGLTLDETTDMGFRYFGFGAKYYIDRYIQDLGLPAQMSGVFAGLGFGRMTLELTDDEWVSDDFMKTGTATGSVGANMFQFKLGKRWAWGPFTTCIETGYSLGSLDDQVKVKVKYDDGTSETEHEDISDVPLSVGTIGALSLGIIF